jgi:tight adherence protein B
VIGPLLFGFLVAVVVFIIFLAVGRSLTTNEPVDERLAQYGITGDLADGDAGTGASDKGAKLSGLNRALAGLSASASLSALLTRTDLPMTAAEFALIMIGLGAGGFLLGMFRFGILAGAAIGLVASYLPIIYLRSQISHRRIKFGEQLPDALALMVGALRTGYGLLQAMEMLVTQMPAPMSVELSRVVRLVGLGVPMQRALGEMARRMENDDLDLVVTAISVQYELGGNLAQTLETITETIRDRVRIKREIRSLTGQQRATAYLLAIMPVGTAAILYVLNPGYIGRLFEPGLIRVLPAGAALMVILGFVVMNKIVAIEV